jgi:hypothetical protein
VPRGEPKVTKSARLPEALVLRVQEACAEDGVDWTEFQVGALEDALDAREGRLRRPGRTEAPGLAQISSATRR